MQCHAQHATLALANEVFRHEPGACDAEQTRRGPVGAPQGQPQTLFGEEHGAIRREREVPWVRKTAQNRRQGDFGRSGRWLNRDDGLLDFRTGRESQGNDAQSERAQPDGTAKGRADTARTLPMGVLRGHTRYL